MNSANSLRILFIADESTHIAIFHKIIVELNKIMPVWFKIIYSNSLSTNPLSIRFYCKYELKNYKKIIEKVHPDLLIVANDQGIKTAFIRICKLKKIPSIVIQDGLLINNEPKGIKRFLAYQNYLLWSVFSRLTEISVIAKLSFLVGRQWCIPSWGTGNADYITAMGNYSRQVLISRGVSSDRIVVTGYPLLDDFYFSNLETEFTRFKWQTAEGNQPVVLLFTQPLVEDGLWALPLRSLHFNSVVDAVKHVNGKLVVKVHPREDIKTYQLLASKYSGVSIEVVKEFSVDTLILDSDVVVTVSSTVGLWQ